MGGMARERSLRRIRARARRYAGKILAETLRWTAWRRHLPSAACRLCAAVLPERQLFVRSEGRVRALRLCWRRQAALSLATMALLASMALGVTTLQQQRANNELQGRELRRLTADHETLEQRYGRLRELVTQANYLRSEPEGSVLGRPLRLSLAFGGALAEDGPQVTRVTPPPLDIKVETASRLLAAARTELRAAEGRKQELQQHLSELERRLAQVQALQSDLIDRLATGTDRTIDQLEEALSLTGLDLDGLIDRVIIQGTEADDKPGAGGPFISAMPPGAADDIARAPLAAPEADVARSDEFDAVVSQISLRVARLSALSTLAERLPLAAPVQDYDVRSPFGRRRDPISGRWAQHAGIDLDGDHRTPILSAAPGAVTVAGWNGPYGRMVEIDHGYGLKTRYAHLYRILVKRGERVVKQQPIGIMGSSGRSTGRHLHYEVHFDDRPLDPITFLKAGDHVFKNGQN